MNNSIDDFSKIVNIADPEKTKYEMKQKGEDRGLILPTNALDQHNTVLLPDALGNLGHIFEGIINGDDKLLKTPEFQALNFDNIKAALEWLAKTDQISDDFKSCLLTEGWRLNYKCKPPTPEEFLSIKYIGPTAETLFPHIRKAFIDFMDPLAPYRTGIWYSCIGSGKSALTALINLYISTLFAMMWHPYKYFGLSSATVFVQALGAWSQKKGGEILLEPIKNIIETSPYFTQVRGHADMLESSSDPMEVAEHLDWTTASKTSVLQFQNGINYKLVSGDKDIIGTTLVTGNLTELAFFQENGWSEDDVWKFFSKMRNRIESRMHHGYMGRFILDSSPNNLEAIIDKWIDEQAPKDPENFFLKGARWDLFPWEFKEALDDEGQVKPDFNTAFPLFTGGGGKPATVIETPEQLATYNKKDVMWVPLYQVTSTSRASEKIPAVENPVQFMRDQCGKPSGAADRIFYEDKVVDDVFQNNLKSVFSNIIALKEENPEHLIWNQVKDIFFNKVMNEYYYYYEPTLPRSASVDLAINGDTASIALSHVEWAPNSIDEYGGQLKMYVTDFVIPVIPKGGAINLDAFKFFIQDLIVLGHMNIPHVSFDGFQSRPIMQALERSGVAVELLSVDNNMVPYNTMIDYTFHRRWACGKNIMVKNNLLSLQYSKRKSGSTKVDHKKGKNVYTDATCPACAPYSELAWSTSKVGYLAKDTTDSIAASISLLDTYTDEYMPRKVWDPGASLVRTYDTVKSQTEQFLSSMGLYVD